MWFVRSLCAASFLCRHVLNGWWTSPCAHCFAVLPCYFVLPGCVLPVFDPVDCSLRVACCRFLQSSWILLCCAGRPVFIQCVSSHSRVVRGVCGRGFVCGCSAPPVVSCFSYCCVEYALFNFSPPWFVAPLCCGDPVLWYVLDLLFRSHSRLPSSFSP